jgi:hypothetical protein
MKYSVLFQGLDGIIWVALAFKAADDVDALRHGAEIQQAYAHIFMDFEVWQGNRRIMTR